MRGLGAFLRQGLVVKLAGRFGIERQVELIIPPELETRFGYGVVVVLRAGMAFGQIGGVGGDLVCDDAVFDVFLVRQTEMFFRRDLTTGSAELACSSRRLRRSFPSYLDPRSNNDALMASDVIAQSCLAFQNPILAGGPPNFASPDRLGVNR